MTAKEMLDLHRTAWLALMPADVRGALSTVTAMSKLRELRSGYFQQIGRYDGAMSEECKASCRRDYDAVDALIKQLEADHA